MKIGSFNSLTEMVRKSDFTPQSTEEFRAKGQEVVDQAIRTFFNPRREIADGQQAVQDMMDLQSAVEAMGDKTRHQFEANAKKGTKQAQELQSSSALPARQEKLENAQSLPDYDGSTFTITQGRRVFDQEQIRFETPKADELRGLHSFAQAMHTVLPLYTCVAMVPGPLSVSVKNFAKEVYQASEQSSSYSSTQGENHSVAGSLLLLGGKVSDTTTTASSSSQSSSQTQASLTSVDERVLPGLFEVRQRLDQLQFAPEKQGNLSGYQESHDYYTEKGQEHQTRRSGSSSRDLGTLMVEPAHFWMPESSTSLYEPSRRDW